MNVKKSNVLFLVVCTLSILLGSCDESGPEKSMADSEKVYATRTATFNAPVIKDYWRYVVNGVTYTEYYTTVIRIGPDSRGYNCRGYFKCNIEDLNLQSGTPEREKFHVTLTLYALTTSNSNWWDIADEAVYGDGDVEDMDYFDNFYNYIKSNLQMRIYCDDLNKSWAISYNIQFLGHGVVRFSVPQSTTATIRNCILDATDRFGGPETLRARFKFVSNPQDMYFRAFSIEYGDEDDHPFFSWMRDWD